MIAKFKAWYRARVADWRARHPGARIISGTQNKGAITMTTDVAPYVDTDPCPNCGEPLDHPTTRVESCGLCGYWAEDGVPFGAPFAEPPAPPTGPIIRMPRFRSMDETLDAVAQYDCWSVHPLMQKALDAGGGTIRLPAGTFRSMNEALNAATFEPSLDNGNIALVGNPAGTKIDRNKP